MILNVEPLLSCSSRLPKGCEEKYKVCPVTHLILNHSPSVGNHPEMILVYRLCKPLVINQKLYNLVPNCNLLPLQSPQNEIPEEEDVQLQFTFKYKQWYAIKLNVDFVSAPIYA